VALQELGKSLTFFYDMFYDLHNIVELGVINHDVSSLSDISPT